MLMCNRALFFGIFVTNFLRFLPVIISNNDDDKGKYWVLSLFRFFFFVSKINTHFLPSVAPMKVTFSLKIGSYLNTFTVFFCFVWLLDYYSVLVCSVCGFNYLCVLMHSYISAGFAYLWLYLYLFCFCFVSLRNNTASGWEICAAVFEKLRFWFNLLSTLNFDWFCFFL